LPGVLDATAEHPAAQEKSIYMGTIPLHAIKEYAGQTVVAKTVRDFHH